MKFNENRAIYLQIADKIMDDIVAGVYTPDSRIPSVREYGALVEVNANTVMRTYDYLEREGIIYNKRGIGFFVSEDAGRHILELRRHTFFSDEIGYFFGRLAMLGVTPDELNKLYIEFMNKKAERL